MNKIFPLKIIKDKINFDFMSTKKYAFSLSVILTIGSFILIGLFGLNLGIDFKGGILIEARFSKTPDIANLREELSKLNIGEVSLQTIGDNNNILIRIAAPKNLSDKNQIINIVKQELEIIDNDTDYRKIDYVGPQVGKELISNSAWALAFSFIAIMAYMWFRFEWQYGIGVIVALLHDAILTLGFISLLGLEFNLTSIAALLTVIGYSVNDSVVIYDRIRENLRKYKKMEKAKLINLSINETLSRTTLTVLTTLLACVALICFGGEVIYSFSMSTFIGIIIGTYSSIFISAPILLYIKKSSK